MYRPTAVNPCAPEAEYERDPCGRRRLRTPGNRTARPDGAPDGGEAPTRRAPGETIMTEKPLLRTLLPTPGRGASGAAVPDLETGLVWQRVPGATAVRWVNARRACYGANTGGRFGWRLPRVAELATLLTPGPTRATSFSSSASGACAHPEPERRLEARARRAPGPRRRRSAGYGRRRRAGSRTPPRRGAAWAGPRRAAARFRPA